ncbi:Acetyltransferase (GNAT) family protein [Parasphingorhabdus marina DSM 22363]|uniref:Acetyltransferase (GNAT) family protein n=1 Tax=Parasphingorhabdus marina DSM 22363 TaxID=1123272 RepID=A0A1N6ELK6_9SPHN|nr:GNAT family N-acetyltransferase [Parasphingorhabdus marina]SIN83865.1 Acetyltransferase (GNAT) family protein [Parasphingorhabdus marina DSM 22363]
MSDPDQPPEITIAAPDQRQRFMHTIILGFATDPLVRFSTPGADVYLEGFAEFMTLFGGRAFDHEGAWIANDGQAVALWLPPGVEPDGDAMMELLPGLVPEENQDDMFGVFEGMDSYHPHEEHWYLPLIAADPAYLGRGLGGALMKYACARIDQDGKPAYLESSNPRNISLYERHGFEVMGEIRSGKAPVVTPMYRAARG